MAILAAPDTAKADHIWNGVAVGKAGHYPLLQTRATSTHSSRNIADATNGSSLDAADLHTTSGNLDFEWDTNANRPPQFVNFQFDGQFDLGEIVVWNSSISGGIKGAKDVEIFVSDTYQGHSSGGAQNAANMTSLGMFEFARKPAGDPWGSQSIDLSAFNLTDIAHVRFHITTNWVDKHQFLDPSANGGADSIPNPLYVAGGGGWLMSNLTELGPTGVSLRIHNNSRTGLNEVQFFEGAVIPEPTSFVLGLLGLLGLGSFARRRTR